MIALLDGDILAWRCAASCEPTKSKLIREPESEAILRLDQLVYSILNDTAADKHRVFLSGSSNFRKVIYPDYKANRRDLPRPEWLDVCREFLVREWGAEITDGYEADDGIGIAADENSCICSIDKDLNQLTGQHYNFVTKTHYFLDDNEAQRAFWSSVLQGDRADNIPGIKGMGSVKANRALLGLDPKEMEDRVRSYYEDHRLFLLNIKLLKILRSEQEYLDILEEIYANEFKESQGEIASAIGC